jgi:hypothetical protein
MIARVRDEQSLLFRHNEISLQAIRNLVAMCYEGLFDAGFGEIDAISEIPSLTNPIPLRNDH